MIMMEDYCPNCEERIDFNELEPDYMKYDVGEDIDGECPHCGHEFTWCWYFTHVVNINY